MAKTLQQYRKELGWSQAELARRAGLSAQTVSKAEAGQPITGRTAREIVRALSGISVYHLSDITGWNVKV